eukprot:GDKJ01013924.1.p1 GENE.GDKJ01013924.1~~GDKJ01013924.1.p1  ORF type:complete len:122 (-),score=24.58 GDKJ01013924.1:216-581(-)
MLVNYSHMISPVAAAPPEYTMGGTLMLPYRFPCPMEGSMKLGCLGTGFLQELDEADKRPESPIMDESIETEPSVKRVKLEKPIDEPVRENRATTALLQNLHFDESDEELDDMFDEPDEVIG